MPAGVIYILHALRLVGPQYVPNLFFFLLQKASLASPIINLISIEAYRTWIIDNFRKLGYLLIGQHIVRGAIGHITVITLRDT